MSCGVASQLARLYTRSCTACTVDLVAMLVSVSAHTLQISLPMLSLDACLYTIVSATAKAAPYIAILSPPSPLPLFCHATTPATVSMLHTGSLHSLQADINRLSAKLQQSTTTGKGLATDGSWKQLSAQCDRLMRNRITLRNSQPSSSAWGWMGEEPPGTTVGNLNQKVAALEDALDAGKRYSIATHPCPLWKPTLAAKRRWMQ